MTTAWHDQESRSRSRAMRFCSLVGVGANVGEGQRFTRMPRADLTGAGEWATHVPARATGPNAASCNSCHNLPTDDGSGLTSSNVHRVNRWHFPDRSHSQLLAPEYPSMTPPKIDFEAIGGQIIPAIRAAEIPPDDDFPNGCKPDLIEFWPSERPSFLPAVQG